MAEHLLPEDAPLFPRQRLLRQSIDFIFAALLPLSCEDGGSLLADEFCCLHVCIVLLSLLFGFCIHNFREMGFNCFKCSRNRSVMGF